MNQAKINLLLFFRKFKNEFFASGKKIILILFIISLNFLIKNKNFIKIPN